jgi:polar amino acid transport system substrate-binding protein
MRYSRLVVLAVGLSLLCASASAAESSSIWNSVMSTGKLVTCVVPAYQPYSWKDNNGKWQGFAVKMAQDTAYDLHVQPVFVETSFKTVVLDLQSAKCDVFYGFNATPERALAIDFAGPLYTLGFLALDRTGWSPPGNAWTDLNNPNTRICFTIGNSTAQQVKRFDPEARQVQLTSSNDCILALISRRADTYIDGVMAILAAKQKNADLGQVRVLAPQYALPSYAGMRIDSDGRFQKFLQRWAEYNRADGTINEWLVNAMSSVGITQKTIPPGLQF